MTAFHLKLLAIITMVIDHLGLFIFPDQVVFRIIGRISFPIFAFLIANGVYHTNSLSKYFFRMLLFAFISHPVFTLANQLVDPQTQTLNVLYTFSFALLAIILIKKTTSRFIQIISVLSCAVIAEMLHTDYGAFGVLLTLTFYIFYQSPKKYIFSFILLSVLYSLNFVSDAQSVRLASLNLNRIISLFSLPFILSYNTKPGPKTKYLFYWFYPLHFLVFYLIKLLQK